MLQHWVTRGIVNPGAGVNNPTIVGLFTNVEEIREIRVYMPATSQIGVHLINNGETVVPWNDGEWIWAIDGATEYRFDMTGYNLSGMWYGAGYAYGTISATVYYVAHFLVDVPLGAPPPPKAVTGPHGAHEVHAAAKSLGLRGKG